MGNWVECRASYLEKKPQGTGRFAGRRLRDFVLEMCV